jgi:hypothetical protein
MWGLMATDLYSGPCSSIIGGADRTPEEEERPAGPRCSVFDLLSASWSVFLFGALIVANKN